MPDLSQNIRELQRKAARMYTEDLFVRMAEDMGSLEDKLTSLERAALARSTAQDGESRYVEAYGEAIAILVSVAVVSVELSLNRQVTWSYDEISSMPLDIGPN